MNYPPNAPPPGGYGGPPPGGYGPPPGGYGPPPPAPGMGGPMMGGMMQPHAPFGVDPLTGALLLVDGHVPGRRRSVLSAEITHIRVSETPAAPRERV